LEDGASMENGLGVGLANFFDEVGEGRESPPPKEEEPAPPRREFPKVPPEP
jgi:hypothetical protein